MLDENNGNLQNDRKTEETDTEQNLTADDKATADDQKRNFTVDDKKQADSVTYSWVNPKISRREETKQDQNWSGRTFIHENPFEDRTDSHSNGSDYASGSGTSGTSGWGNASSGSTSAGGFSSGDGQNGGRASGVGSESRYAGDGRRQGFAGTKPKRRFLSTIAGKWILLVVMAVVFGLIAGLVSFGVGRAASGSSGAGQNGGTAGTGQQNPSQNVIAGSHADEPSDNQADNSKNSASDGGEGDSTSTVAEVVSKTMPSVVTISTVSVQEMQNIFGGTQNYEVEGAGSGVIVGENDTEMLIATNAHVVDGAQQLSVGFNDETAVSGDIKGQDSQNDLAVIAVKLSDIPEETKGKIAVIELGDSDQLALGEQVVALGNALGLGTSVTSGYISALNRTVSFSEGMQSENLIQTDAAINSGNSGGALVNMSGQLIGINEGRASSAGDVSVDNVGYSIPISKAEPILEKMMNLKTREKNSEEDRGYLGITCANVNSEAAKQYSMPVGVYVRSVVSGAAADQAGIRQGDVITELDGRSITTYEDLTGALAYYKSGETVEMTISRSQNGEYKEQTVEVTLSSRSEASVSSGN